MTKGAKKLEDNQCVKINRQEIEGKDPSFDKVWLTGEFRVMGDSQ